MARKTNSSKPKRRAKSGKRANFVAVTMAKLKKLAKA
jgi:hypothetical protein